MRKWSEIVNDERYNQLSSDEKFELRKKYLNKYILPLAKEEKLDINEYKKKFYLKTIELDPDTFQKQPQVKSKEKPWMVGAKAGFPLLGIASTVKKTLDPYLKTPGEEFYGEQKIKAGLEKLRTPATEEEIEFKKETTPIGFEPSPQYKSELIPRPERKKELSDAEQADLLYDKLHKSKNPEERKRLRSAIMELEALRVPMIDPVVDLAFGAAYGFKAGKAVGQAGKELAKTMGREAVGEVTLGGSELARLTKGSKVFSKKIKQELQESAEFLDFLNRSNTSKQVKKGIFEGLDKSKKTIFKEKLINDWQRVKDLAKTPGLELTSKLNPYETRKLMFKKITNKVDETTSLVSKIDKNILETAQKIDIPDEQLKKDVYRYLIARHAPERNAVLGTKAAGMTDQEAKKVIQSINKSPNSKEITRIADNLQKFHNETLDILYADGNPWSVIDEDTYKLLKSKYPHHIPLQRELGEDVVEGLMQRGLDVKGTGLRRAKGSQLKVKDIMENVYIQRVQAIQRLEKNIVDNSTYRFVQDFMKSFPEQELFDIITPKAIGKTWEGKIIKQIINDPQILQFQLSGKPAYIKINDRKLATALKGVNREQVPQLVKYMGGVSRYIASMATRYNPEFVLSNKMRDLQEAIIYLAAEKNTGKITRTVLNDPKSIIDIKDFLRGKNTKGAMLYKELRELGGAGGGISLTTKSQAVRSLDKIIKTNRNRPRKLFHDVAKTIDNWNIVFEDSTRLSAYKAAIREGVNKQKAAIIAKNVSIDFDEMGTWSPLINSLYVFSNASIQGSAKMIRAMRNPKVATAVTAAVGTAVFTTSKYNDELDPEWRNKVSKWDKLNGLNIVLPTEKFNYISIPVSWGLKPIKVAMDYGYDLLNDKEVDIKDATSKIISSIVEGYSPISAGSVGQAVIPSPLRPITDVAMNRSWTGYKIKPDYDKYAPESIRYYEQLEKSVTGKAIIKGTEQLAEKGIEVSPADVNYVLDQIMGGGGRFAKKTINTVTSLTQGNIPAPRETPFVGRILRATPEEYYRDETEQRFIEKEMTEVSRKRFYENKELRNLFEQTDPDIYNYIENQPTEEQPRIIKKVIALMRKQGIPDKRWYENLKSLPPQIRSTIFMNRYEKVSPEIQDKMLQIAAQMKGILTSDFFIEQQKREEGL